MEDQFYMLLITSAALLIGLRPISKMVFFSDPVRALFRHQFRRKSWQRGVVDGSVPVVGKLSHPPEALGFWMGRVGRPDILGRSGKKEVGHLA